jgi:membrane-bound serine protease (ClpP class)
MRVRAVAVLMLLVGVGLSLVPARAQEQPPPKSPLIQSIDFDLTINPASAEWAKEALDDAKKAHAYMVIFRLDTPGGLDDSMR